LVVGAHLEVTSPLFAIIGGVDIVLDIQLVGASVNWNVLEEETERSIRQSGRRNRILVGLGAVVRRTKLGGGKLDFYGARIVVSHE
jgi:hypothetical protein